MRYLLIVSGLLGGLAISVAGTAYAAACCSNKGANAVGQQDSAASLDQCAGAHCEVKFVVILSNPKTIEARVECTGSDHACISSKTTDDAHGNCLGTLPDNNGYNCGTEGTYTRRRLTGGYCKMIGPFFNGCHAATEDLTQQEHPANKSAILCPS